MEISKIYKEAEKLQIHSLRPFQELIIYSIIDSVEKGYNTPLLSILPTGGGKSLCFTIPALLLDGVTIIVYPIKALMHDQISYFKANHIPSEILEGGMKWDEIQNALNNLKRKKSKILVTNIEMLSSYKIQTELRLLKIALFVVDEAHTVITWGESFRPLYLKIGQIAKFIGARVILAFTATTNDYINKRLKEVLFLNANYHLIQGGSNRSNLIFHAKKTISKKAEIMQILKDKNKFPAIIFVQRKIDAQSLSAFFSKYFETKYYHAALDSKEKLDIESWFYHSKSGLLIATCAYGMGVNKKDIRTVIHYSLPQSATDYLQESGRGGRDGKLAHSYALLADEDKSELVQLFLHKSCIRASLIKSLGQMYGESCTGCSYCLDENIYDYAFSKRLIAFIKRRIIPLTYKKLLDRIQTEINPVLPYYSHHEAIKLINTLIKEKRIKKILNFII